MGEIIAIVLLILLAILAMMIMTMVYHLFYGVMPFIAAIMIIAGLVVGLWHAIKNTIVVTKEIYGKKK